MANKDVDAGWVDSTRPEAHRWLNKEDLEEGATWQGKLEDVLLVADEEPGTYRVGYMLQLTAKGRLPDDEVGSCVILGEKAQLNQLRERSFGDEVRLTVRGTKALPGKRTMHLFSIAFRPGDGKRGTVASRLRGLFEMTKTQDLPF